MSESKDWRETIEFDGPPTVEVIDSENQSLMFRVGPVYVGGKVIAKALWVEYQSERMRVLPLGPVLISEEGWRELAHIINGMFNNE